MKPVTTWTVYTVAFSAFWSSPFHIFCHWKAEGGAGGACEAVFLNYHLIIIKINIKHDVQKAENKDASLLIIPAFLLYLKEQVK